jgi:hypothetical protein
MMGGGEGWTPILMGPAHYNPTQTHTSHTHMKNYTYMPTLIHVANTLQ